MGNFAVSLKRLVEKVSLEVIYTPCDLDKISVEIAEVNRPGLFLAGYYDYLRRKSAVSALTSCSASSLRPSSSAATRNWNPSRRCRSLQSSTG